MPASLEILYVDSALLVVNKPAGFATLPDGYDPTLPHIKSVLEGQFGRLWVVHRLDKGTSGVLLLARSAEAHRALNTQFEQHQVAKIYHALVIGCPGWQERTVDLPLRPNGDRHHRTVADPQAGKPAITHLRILERFEPYCLLEAIPETGRTHQIRAHLASLGLYILGDKLYAPRSLPPQVTVQTSQLPEDGMALHARSIQIRHPDTNAQLTFVAPYPPAWDELLSQLRRLP